MRMDYREYDKVIEVKKGDVVTVTDPCYDRGSGAEIHVPVGRYQAFYEKVDEGDWGIRVSRCAIAPEGCDTWDVEHAHRVRTSSVGVDAGLCGFFVNKPDYDDAAWDAFCDMLTKADEQYEKDTGRKYKNVYHTDEGFFTSSGYGDGEYNVHMLDMDGKIGVEIVFIGDEEDEDEGDWEDDEDDE